MFAISKAKVSMKIWLCSYPRPSAAAAPPGAAPSDPQVSSPPGSPQLLSGPSQKRLGSLLLMSE